MRQRDILLLKSVFKALGAVAFRHRRERIIRTRFKDAYFAQYFGKNPYNIRILSRILTSSCAKSAIFKIRRTLKPEFLDDFGAWRSPPSAYLARVISAQSAKNSRFRAGSDSSLSPKDITNKEVADREH